MLMLLVEKKLNWIDICENLRRMCLGSGGTYGGFEFHIKSMDFLCMFDIGFGLSNFNR